jgi:hypothetical protein
MKPVVFLGSTLSRRHAETLLDAEYRPAIRRGDLATLPRLCPVLIIDGEFDQSFSVSPKEILALIDSGRSVVGASSMGALRAAELAPYGMEGIGWVFNAYRSGHIEGDDEVALRFSPIDGSAITVPLVNVRYWLERSVERGLLDASASRRCLRRARSIFYAERTAARLDRMLKDCLGQETLRGLLEAEGGVIPDIKQRDAELALKHMDARQTL